MRTIRTGNELTPRLADIKASKQMRWLVLLGPGKKSEEVMKKAVSWDNQGVDGFQRQIIKEQDKDLEILEERVASTKHIVLAVNEELSLHTRLLDNLDEHVDTTNSHIRQVWPSVLYSLCMLFFSVSILLTV
ncbi:syntaxin-51-like isoform X1 [Prosopis cineraria]|uniref:syntaxin-51-like isoform X1 n=2 Tax=Prosopis cineraria TaxID=364024 RepID=UPI00240F40C0|nr:syntaxin-51-like isoform X1 [Prosopis cineraria]